MQLFYEPLLSVHKSKVHSNYCITYLNTVPPSNVLHLVYSELLSISTTHFLTWAVLSCVIQDTAPAVTQEPSLPAHWPLPHRLDDCVHT